MPKHFLSRKPIDDGFGAKIDNEFSEIDMDIVLDWGQKILGIKQKSPQLRGLFIIQS